MGNLRNYHIQLFTSQGNLRTNHGKYDTEIRRHMKSKICVPKIKQHIKKHLNLVKIKDCRHAINRYLWQRMVKIFSDMNRLIHDYLFYDPSPISSVLFSSRLPEKNHGRIMEQRGIMGPKMTLVRRI